MLYRFKAYRFCDFGDGHIRSLYKLKRMEHPNADDILMKRLPDAVEHGAVYIVRMIVELSADRCIVDVFGVIFLDVFDHTRDKTGGVDAAFLG